MLPELILRSLFCITYDSVTLAILVKQAGIGLRSLMAWDTAISCLFGAVGDFSPLLLWSRGQKHHQ